MQITYDELMKELREMRGHYDSGFSILERQRIEELYWYLLRKQVQNIACSDCYRDAFLEIFTYLNREGRLPEEKHYELKEGKCLHIFGSSEYLFQVTDEQAETFLAQCPSAIDQFKTYPDDWEERVKTRKTRKSYKRAAEKRAERRREKAEAENAQTEETD